MLVPIQPEEARKGATSDELSGIYHRQPPNDRPDALATCSRLGDVGIEVMDVRPMIVSVAVRPSNVAFHPPEDLGTPLIMICAGTGLAPFRGFLQERANQATNGRPLGKTLLFFGCDHPDVDLLYRDELEAWEKAGVVEVRSAFAMAPQGDVKYVQHRLWQERADVVALFQQGARIFVCGDARTVMAGVRDTAARIYQEATHCSTEDAERWVGKLEQNHSRFYADVFA